MGQSRGGSAWRIGRADDKYAGLAQLGRASALLDKLSLSNYYEYKRDWEFNRITVHYKIIRIGV